MSSAYLNILLYSDCNWSRLNLCGVSLWPTAKRRWKLSVEGWSHDLTDGSFGGGLHQQIGSQMAQQLTTEAVSGWELTPWAIAKSFWRPLPCDRCTSLLCLRLLTTRVVWYNVSFELIVRNSMHFNSHNTPWIFIAIIIALGQINESTSQRSCSVVSRHWLLSFGWWT